jgi:group I intron endonuclease
MIIYKATNVVNGKLYIGMTIKTIHERRKQHFRNAKRTKTLFAHALRKYGEDGFEWEVIDTAETHEKLQEKEIHWIKYYNSTNQDVGYNLCTGGGGFSGFSHTEETKQKMSESKLGKARPDGIKRFYKDTQKGEGNYNSKLTEADIREIRRLSEEGHTNTHIGKIFEVSNFTISKIVRRVSWKHVS